MLDTRYFLRPRCADHLHRTPHGLEMRLDSGDRLRVGVWRADVLRSKISRRGVFDERPTYAALDRGPETLGGSAEFGYASVPFWGGFNTAHVQNGLAGIWNDMNEPATGDIPADAMSFDHGRQPHAQFHHEHAMLMAMGTVEGLLAARPGQRTFVLTRAGSPGIQPYAANWPGDNRSRGEHLWMNPFTGDRFTLPTTGTGFSLRAQLSTAR